MIFDMGVCVQTEKDSLVLSKWSLQRKCSVSKFGAMTVLFIDALKMSSCRALSYFDLSHSPFRNVDFFVIP